MHNTAATAVWGLCETYQKLSCKANIKITKGLQGYFYNTSKIQFYDRFQSSLVKLPFLQPCHQQHLIFHPNKGI